MKEQASILSLGTALSLLGGAGCIPAAWTPAPEISGRVVSVEHQPVPNAIVTIRQTDAGTMPPASSVFDLRADSTGHFFRAEQTQWALVPLLPLDGLGQVYSATAHANGLQSEPMPLGGAISNPHFLGLGNAYPKMNLGDLMLVRPLTAVTQDTDSTRH